jgi:hypothetical protein
MKAIVLDSRLTDGGEVVSFTCTPDALYPQKILGSQFILEARTIVRLEHL